MSKFVIHAGDVPAGDGLGRIIPKMPFSKKPHGRQFLLPKPGGGIGYGEEIWPTDFAEIEMASEESVKSVCGAVGWGVAGAALFGPVGLLAGALMGGRKDEVTFVAKLKDGRKMLGTMEKKDYNLILQTIMAGHFGNN